jgi:murein L,D-transpeptidase YcbB/YkuD
MNKTAVFSGQMNQIVFSPYWNVPTSILRKEIYQLSQKKQLLSKTRHGMGRRVRQRPGPQNALGQSEIHFPNSYYFYA